MDGLTLIVVSDDLAGSMNALARDLRRLGQVVRVISLAPQPKLGFPVDLHQGIDGGRELLSVAGAATRLHLVDCSFDVLGSWVSPIKAKIQVGKVQLSMQFDGALNATYVRQELRNHQVDPTQCWSTRPELAKELGVDFIPPYLPIERAPYRPLLPGARERQSKSERARFFFSARKPLLQYPEIEALLDTWESGERKDLDLRISGSHAEVLACRRRALVTACAGRQHLSRSALEALAAGLIVVCPRLGPWIEAYERLAEGQPAPVLDQAQFLSAMEALTPETEPLLEARAWVSKVLDPKRWWQRFGASSAQAVHVA